MRGDQMGTGPPNFELGGPLSLGPSKFGIYELQKMALCKTYAMMKVVYKFQ